MRKNYKSIAICIFSLILSGCQLENEISQEAKIVNVEVSSPSYETISVNGSFVGTVEANDVVSVMPKISGQVVERYFEVGDYVNAGDLLFVIDDKALQIEKKNADAGVQSAIATLEAQKANSTAIQAAANEALGTINTTQYEREKALLDAEREISTSRYNESITRQQEDYYNREAEKARSQMNNADKQISELRQYHGYLSNIKNDYLKYEKEGETAKAEECIKKSNFLDYAELSAAADAVQNAIDSMITEKKDQEGNYSSSIEQKIEAGIKVEIEKRAVANAEAAKTLAQRMLQDFELFTKNTIIAESNAKIAEGEANIVASESLLQGAKATQDLANLQLSYTKVTSPISGVISEINIVQHDVASDQNAAYVIIGQNTKKITFGVTEMVKQNIKLGQAITIQRDDKEYVAVISKINDNLKPGEVLFKIEADIQDIGDSKFVIGTKFKVLTSIDRQENVLTVPISSLYYDDGKPYLYVAEDGKSVRREVVTGISDNSRIQILSGIGDGEQVITSWSSSLKDKTDIVIVNTETTEKQNNTVEENMQDGESSVNSNQIDISRNNNLVPQPESGVAVETTDNVNIRKEADISSERLDTVPKGTRFEKIKDTDNGWTKIRYQSGEAYIKSDYLKAIQ